MLINILERESMEETINDLQNKLATYNNIQLEDIQETVYTLEEWIENNNSWVELWVSGKMKYPEDKKNYNILIDKAMNQNKIFEECLSILREKLTTITV